MKIMVMLSTFLIIFCISSCTPTPTPYVSNIDPCAPDILTAIASAGGIPRCDKIPTEHPLATLINIGKQRENEVVTLLNGLISDPRYDPTNQVLAKYMNNIDVDIDDVGLHFFIDYYPTNNDTDGISLAAELIKAGTLISLAGESGDWRLGIIEVNYPADSASCGVSFYVNDEYDLARINQGQVSIYDVMEVFVCELKTATLLPIPTTNALLCTDTYNMIGSTVECKIPRAFCNYYPTTSGEPTFCHDAPYPNNNFSLVIWGEDWSFYDGKCIIVRGVVSNYEGKPQIENIGGSQISSCP